MHTGDAIAIKTISCRKRYIVISLIHAKRPNDPIQRARATALDTARTPVARAPLQSLVRPNERATRLLALSVHGLFDGAEYRVGTLADDPADHARAQLRRSP